MAHGSAVFEGAAFEGAVFEGAVFDDEHAAFRESFRLFLDREVLPGREKWHRARRAPGAVFLRAGENGFLGMQVPEEYGGGGVDDPRFGVVVAQETTRAGLPGLALAFTTHVSLAIPLLAAYADAGQQARWLPGLASGETLAAVVTSTPVRYTTTSDGVRLAGVAPAVVNGTAAGLLVVRARSASDDERLVLVDPAAHGLSREPGPELLGVFGADVTDVHLDGVEVPAADVLGGDAAEQALALSTDQQLSLAVIGVAGARTALAWTIDYVRNRTVFGRPVAAFENTRYALADVVADITMAEALLDACIRDRVAGRLATRRAATAKLRCTELYGRAVDQGMQLHGGYGYMQEYPIAQAYADARYLRLHGGSSETMKEIIAKEHFGA